jgi:pimeloyl-ACP methyl ester carboxylesterase
LGAANIGVLKNEENGMALMHRLFDLNGTRIHAVEQGEGPLVILIHGFPESWYSWRHQLGALAAAGYRAVAIDQRGYGRSSKFHLQSAYRIGCLVDDIAALVDAYGAGPAVVVGHDWGAPVAWTFAWMYPQKCRGVVGMSVPFADRGLVAFPGCPFGERRPRDLHAEIAGPGKQFYQEYFGAQDGIIAEIEADLRGWLKGAVYTLSGDAIAAFIKAGLLPATDDPIEAIRNSPMCLPVGGRMRDAFVTPPAMPAWFTDADLDFIVAEFERSGLCGPLSFYHNLDADWHDLAAMSGKPLTPPSLFIGGEFDVVTLWGATAIERAAERLTNYRGGHVLPGTGHWIQQERPDETNRLLLEFLHALI